MAKAAKPLSRTSARIFPAGLPILVGFREEVLRALLILWLVLVIGFLTLRWEWAFAVGVWATVTTIMLWPVGRRLGRKYLTYRTVWFILGVLSMAYIPFAGFVLESDVPFNVKSSIWFGLPIDLTIFAIVPSLRPAIGKPIRMFFRPDLVFGDGRVLCCGIIATVLGLRYLIGPHPPEGLPWAIPKWNWWGILFAMLFGFIPMIPLRGMTKILMRMQRLINNRWTGWDAVILRELFLIVTALGIGFGFHHVFKGWVPFSPQTFEEIHEATEHGHQPLGLILLALAILWLVFVRGRYKKSIGEPFIKETVAQTLVKEILLVIGMVPLFIGFMLTIESHFGELNPAPQMYFGLGFLLWGLIVLVPFRVLSQINQRRAIAQQMAAVLLPAQIPGVRRTVLTKIMHSLAEMPEAQRLDYMRAMQEAISEQPDDVRRIMTTDRMSVLADLPSEQRQAIMRAMDRILLT